MNFLENTIAQRALYTAYFVDAWQQLYYRFCRCLYVCMPESESINRWQTIRVLLSISTLGRNPGHVSGVM